MMTWLRSLTGLLLAAIAVLVIGCSAPDVKVTTYTPEQLGGINTYATSVLALRDRMPELETYIDQKDWVDVQYFIHGPLGELRVRLDRLARQLLPDTQDEAKILAKDLYKHLVKIDEAADTRDTSLASSQYYEALSDFDAYLDLLPAANP